MKEDIAFALLLMPQHREQFKRSRKQTLDDLIDDQRASGKLSSSTFDLVMMAYRYQNLFQTELKRFLKKPLKPRLVEDLMSLTFAAILSRKAEQESGLVYWSVEVAKESFGDAIAPLVNAFCRFVQKDQVRILEHARSHPESLLGPELCRRWKSTPDLLKKTGLKLLERPVPGIDGFDESLQWKHQPISILNENKFQAMNRTSLEFTEACLDECEKRFAKPKKLVALDACAAPGAKLIYFYLKALQDGLSISFEATEAKFSRLERLKTNLRRWELQGQIPTTLFSWGEDKAWNRGPYDIIFADLPCSGSGTISERPDLLAKSFSTEIKALSEIQIPILKELQQQLKPEGLLFVSLCSIDPEEIQTISRHLSREPFFDSRPRKEWNFEDLVGWFFTAN